MQKRSYSVTLSLFIVLSISIACSEEDAVNPIQPVQPTLPTAPPTPTPPPTLPPVGYTAPVAKAGNDTTIYVPFHNISLNGRESTGNIASYKWAVIKGPSQVGITYYDKPKAFVSGLMKVGVYEFLLTVTDTYNLSSTDTVRVYRTKLYHPE